MDGGGDPPVRRRGGAPGRDRDEERAREARDRLPALAPALRAAARRFGTPLYVTDGATLDAAADAVRAAFPDPWLRAYSLKANDLPAIVARLAARGFGANVVSGGEWALARGAGVPNAAITFEGIGKTDADLRAIVRAAAAGEPLRWVAVESADEAAALARIARASGLADLRVDALVRLNPSVEPETHAGLATGSRGSKFGVHPDEVGAVIEAGGGADGPVRWRGIHLHVGSQLGAIDAWRDAVRRGLALLALLRGGMPDFDTLDVGGGMPVEAWRAGGGGAKGSVADDVGATGPTPTGPAVTALDPARFAAEIPLLLEIDPVRSPAAPPGRRARAGDGRVGGLARRPRPPRPRADASSGPRADGVVGRPRPRHPPAGIRDR